MQAAKRYNIEVWQGKTLKETIRLNAAYAVALIKRNELISKGTLLRSVWIVAADKPKTK